LLVALENTFAMHRLRNVKCIQYTFLYMLYLCSVPEDDQDTSKHVGVTSLCLKNIILTLVHLLALLC